MTERPGAVQWTRPDGKKSFFITFGETHIDPRGYCLIWAHSYLEARERILQMVWNKWAFIYPTADAAGVEKFGLKLIRETEG